MSTYATRETGNILRRTVSAGLAVLAAALLTAAAAAAELNLDAVRIVVEDRDRFEVPAQVLIEEIARRTGLTWATVERSGKFDQIVFRAPQGDEPAPAEGFQLKTPSEAPLQVHLIAASRRGAMFGVGYLLRQLDCRPGRVRLADPLDTAQAPEYSIRGHQLGYRAQANSYDAWDEKIYDQYVRELMFFGANAIENIPFQDERPTPIMPLSRPEMNRALSAICSKYDVDYWVWTPADFDLTNAAKRSAAIEFHEAFYRDCVRLDAIFFPGGDPGDNHPREVMPFLADLAKILPQHHPQAKYWLSLQGFGRDEVDYLFDWLKDHQPDWLGGLVAGPGSPPLAILRERLDRRYGLRDYPDITHVVRCQYPERNLDPVFSLTAGREPINPRPRFYAEIFAETASHTTGFISYSDGCHDDVNKTIWSALAWNTKQNIEDVLTEYARLFFGPKDAQEIAAGILALEQNWNGALAKNESVPKTLAHFQQLEQRHPELADNWRWQMLLIRAYYDAYQQARLAYETALEQKANALLEPAADRTPTEAIQEARSVLSRAVSDPVRPDLRQPLIQLFDDLYRQIKFQSSVEKYHAIHPQRGCMLDFLDYPLNNRFWLEDEFHKTLTLPTLEGRWQRLEQLRTWENPGHGSYYDDVGHVGRSPHAVRTGDPRRDTSSYWWVDNGMSRFRLSWLVTGTPASLEYSDLDPQAKYLLRFSGFGELKPRANGQALTPSKYETAMNTIKEYPVPPELVSSGKLSVTFDNVYLQGVNWRQQPRLAEAWLIKRP